ncbi:NACHT domain-containing protein, partial [Bathymodiolus thermophilus thioautotrophic gill symbiont]|uniref:NACHT domain-containing protein n=1 Tax=Bathymodiolus thermophilus thioautotrophic gill symbiont TaxID=2360 RepID=UPI0011173CAE
MNIKTTKNNDALDELLAMVLGKIAATPGNILSAIIKIAKHKGSLRPEKIEVNQLLKEERDLEITDTNFRKNLQKINEAFKEVANTQTPASIRSRGAVLEIDLGDFIDTQVSRNIERPSKSIIPSESNIPPQVISGKRTVSIFISHAWENDPILDEVTREFHQKLKNKLENLPESWRDKYQFKLWIDFENIEAVAAPNNNLKRQFVCKAQEAEFGIMLFSDKWFCSKDCQLEASKFYDKNGEILADKLVIQIALNRNIDKKYKKHPILPKLYGKYETLPSLLKSDNCNDITDFFDNIRDEICCSLDKQTPPEPSKNTIKECLKYNDQYCHIDKVTSKGTESNNSNEKFEVIPKLIQWAKFDDPEKPIVTALLGDFGAGKTTTCQMLTQELWRQHAQDANNPAPIYFDLRNLITFFDDQSNVDTSVETLLEKLIAVTGAQKITGIEVIDYLKDRNTLIIFDGLDEIGNSLGEAKLAEIYRKLLSIIPEKHWQQQPSDKDAEAIITKILVTCRTHFWRDNLQQQSVLSAQGRSKLNQDSPQSKVKVFYLAPFDKEQIEEFLRKKLPEQELKSALQFINNAHDLSDIAKKPLMLNFIFEQLSTLLQAYQSGKIINVATIYHLLFAKTLDRDEGKNLKIMPRSKDRMLQKLALYLWQEQSKSLSTDDLFDWFDDYLLTVNDLIINTQEDRNLLFTELHNASLLVRDDSHYRFSHTSFFEYFQARNIFETLLKTDNSLADLPIDKSISAEALDFVHQIYADSGNSKQEKLQQSLSRYLTYDTNTDKQASKVLRTFLAKLLLQGQSSPAPIPFPKQVDFSYLDLPNLAFIGSEKPLLDLQNAHFEHSDLLNTTFTSVLLNNAVFTNSRLDYCKFDSCHLINSCFVNQDIDQCQLTGAKFHQCVLTGAKLGQVDDSCFFINSLGAPIRQKSIVADKLTMNLGGRSSINSVAISADNRFIVSAGNDKTVRLWDRKTQQPIGSPLQGHSGGVRSVAISADNRFIVSAGYDKTVRLWDRKTQQPIGSPL